VNPEGDGQGEAENSGSIGEAVEGTFSAGVEEVENRVVLRSKKRLSVAEK
jgi:hypothetical protein